MKRKVALVLSVILLGITGCGKSSDMPAAQVSQSEGSNVPAATPMKNSAERGMVLEEKAQKIADILVNTYDRTSIQYAMIDNGNMVLSGSSGVYDKTENKPIEKDNMYGIGSVSKVYATAAVMVLVDQGKVDIDKPLTTYIPAFEMADERYKEITPRMLMNHSSGIYGTSKGNAFLYDDNDTIAHDTILSNLKEQRLKSTPGEVSVYCNDGFSLLEILTENVSGMSYSQFISTYFSEPLGLQNTKTALDHFDKGKIVKAYMPMYEGALPNETLNLIGAGGIYSTAEDICRFAQVVMGQKPEILSEKSALAMQNEEYKKGMWVEDQGENFFAYGLGWDSVNVYPFGDYNIKALAKAGGSVTFESMLVAIPEYHIAMAVVSSGGGLETNYAFVSGILQEYLKEKGVIDTITPPKTFEPTVKSEMPEAFQKYSGTYATESKEMSIEVKDGEMIVDGNDAPEQKFIYTSDNTFKSQDGTLSFAFVTDKEDNTYLQVKNFVVIPEVGTFVLTVYYSQKLTPVTLSAEIADVWKNRLGKKYYAVSEKPTSEWYFLGAAVSDSPIQIKLNDDFSNGYAFAGSKITSENSAVNTMKALTDVTDLDFYMAEGVEYLKASGIVYVSEDSVTDIDDHTTCTIASNGFAKYYHISTTAQGKEMDVKMPENAAYVVYDEDGICVQFTTVSKNLKTILPPNGKIAFVGNAGDVFNITLK